METIMKKALGIIAITTGVISAVSAVILCCLYLDDATRYLVKLKNKISEKIAARNAYMEIEE